MSFDFSTLITDRTSADVSALSELMAKPLDTWTADELEQFNSGLLKGGYWWTDLNRVTACMKYLDEELRGLGYASGYIPVVVHEQPEPEKPLLPDGYTQLEYIESTGTQWIDTGRKPTQDSSVELKFRITLNDESTYAVCGSRNASSGAVGAFGLFKMNSSRFDAYVSGQIKSVSTPANDQHVVVMTGNSILFDGREIAISGSAFTGNYTFLICAMNQLNGVDNRRASMRIYYAKGSIDTDFDMVPCKAPDGSVGMYDTKNEVFHKNAGSGTFLGGPEIVLEPKPEPLDPYSWYKEDNPTITQLQQYLSNATAIRSAFGGLKNAPEVPTSPKKLSANEANDIEKLLVWVETTITTMRQTFVACGLAICGGDYL